MKPERVGWGELLSEIGVENGLLIETIAISLDNEGIPHAAPIGVKRREDKLIIEKLFRGTRTWRNLRTNKKILFVLSDNVLLFYKALTSELEYEDFAPSPLDPSIPTLREGDAAVLAALIEIECLREYDRATLEILGVDIRREGPRYVSRCKNAVIESLVHYTRIPVFSKFDEKEASRLLEFVRFYKEFVERNCPEVPYQRIMRDLWARLSQKDY